MFLENSFGDNTEPWGTSIKTMRNGGRYSRLRTLPPITKMCSLLDVSIKTVEFGDTIMGPI